jgi:hypothetical protein
MRFTSHSKTFGVKKTTIDALLNVVYVVFNQSSSQSYFIDQIRKFTNYHLTNHEPHILIHYWIHSICLWGAKSRNYILSETLTLRLHINTFLVHNVKWIEHVFSSLLFPFHKQGSGSDLEYGRSSLDDFLPSK